MERDFKTVLYTRALNPDSDRPTSVFRRSWPMLYFPAEPERETVKLAKRMRKVGVMGFVLMGVAFGIFFIGLITMPGSYNFDSLPPLMQYSMMLGVVLIGPTLILIFGSNIPRTLAHRRLQKNGLAADARVIKVWETGMRINNNPVVRMLLEVRPPYQHTFEAETERLMSFSDPVYMHPGAVVQVKYDPESKEVAIAD